MSKIFTITTSKKVADAAESLHRSSSGINRKSFAFKEVIHNSGYSQIIFEANDIVTQSDFFNDIFFLGMNVQSQINFQEKHRTYEDPEYYKSSLDHLKPH